MRLLYLCSDFGIDPNGTKGAAVHLRSITRALCDFGHQVRVLSPKAGAVDGHPARFLSRIGGGPAESMGALLKSWLRDHDLNDAPARELRPLIYNAWACEPALAALRSDPPEAIIERLALFGHVGLDLRDALRVPLVIEMNAPLADEAEAYRSLHLRTLAREIERRVLRRADAIAVVSQALAQRLVETGVAAERVHVVPNGADPSIAENAPSREACRARWNLQSEFVVGFVGSLKPWHGVEVLLRAVERLGRDDAQVRLLVVGDGPMAAPLRDRASQLGIADRVIFAGALPHTEIGAVLRAMDVAVAPFVDVPGFYFSPIKLFEYMAAGLCVVASRIGQIAEVIEDGCNGLLCAPDDTEALVQGLLRARRDAELRCRLGTAALRTVQARFTWRHAAERLTRLIEGPGVARRTEGEAVQVA